jgi:hypothetical protein
VPSAFAQESPAEHVLVDMQVWLLPTPDGSGYCAQLGSGMLTVQLQAVGQGPDGQGQPWPVAFSFYGDRGFDVPATINTTISSLDAAVVTAPLKGGGLYCFSLRNTTNVPVNAPTSVIAQYSQGVNFRMSVQPS